MYDIFISYRRKDEHGISNVPIARTIKLEFERRGYKVFFDYSECTDNFFSEKILPAIRTCNFFLLIVTEGSMQRCSNPKDWVRREIEEAIAHKRKIIAITPDNSCTKWPELPTSLDVIDGLQITTIYTDHMFESCVDFLIKNRMQLATSPSLNNHSQSSYKQPNSLPKKSDFKDIQSNIQIEATKSNHLPIIKNFFKKNFKYFLIVTIIITSILFITILTAKKYPNQSISTTSINYPGIDSIQSFVINFSSASANNDFNSLMQMYAPHVERYQDAVNKTSADVVGYHRNYDKRFKVYSKKSSIRPETLTVNIDSNSAKIFVTYIEDYHIDREDKTKYSDYVLEKHLILTPDCKIISEWDVQLQKYRAITNSYPDTKNKDAIPEDIPVNDTISGE